MTTFIRSINKGRDQQFHGRSGVDSSARVFTKSAVPPEQVELMVTQVVKGQSLKFRERRVRSRGKILPS